MLIPEKYATFLEGAPNFFPGWARGAAAVADPPVDGRAADVWLEARTLPDEQRRLLEGVYRAGKTVEQVAGETGLRLGTAKRRLRQALAAMRERLREPASG